MDFLATLYCCFSAFNSSENHGTVGLTTRVFSELSQRCLLQTSDVRIYIYITIPILLFVCPIGERDNSALKDVLSISLIFL